MVENIIEDSFIAELLVGITKYMVLCEQRELQKYALEKANSLLALIKKFYEQSLLAKPLPVNTEAYKSYKILTLEDKIRCLIKEEDVKQIESSISKLDKSLFQTTLSRIIRIINCNYLQEFYRQELINLNRVHAESTKPLGFNSMDSDLPAVTPGRQTNIFNYLAINKPSIQRIQNDMPQNV